MLKKLVEKRNKAVTKIDFIDDWKDEDLYLRKVTARQMFKYSSMKEEELNNIDNIVELVAGCVVHKDNKLAFDSEEGREYLSEMSFGDLISVYQEASAMTVNQDEVDEIKKK